MAIGTRGSADFSSRPSIFDYDELDNMGRQVRLGSQVSGITPEVAVSAAQQGWTDGELLKRLNEASDDLTMRSYAAVLNQATPQVQHAFLKAMDGDATLRLQRVGYKAPGLGSFGNAKEMMRVTQQMGQDTRFFEASTFNAQGAALAESAVAKLDPEHAKALEQFGLDKPWTKDHGFWTSGLPVLHQAREAASIAWRNAGAPVWEAPFKVYRTINDIVDNSQDRYREEMQLVEARNQLAEQLGRPVTIEEARTARAKVEGYTEKSRDELRPVDGVTVDDEFVAAFDQVYSALGQTGDYGSGLGDAIHRAWEGEAYIRPSYQLDALHRLGDYELHHYAVELAKYGADVDEKTRWTKVLEDEGYESGSDAFAKEFTRLQAKIAPVYDEFSKVVRTVEHGKVSVGRRYAEELGMRPDTKPFTVVSGGVDAWETFFLDPFILAGGARAAVASARNVKGIEEIGKWQALSHIDPGDVGRGISHEVRVAEGWDQEAAAYDHLSVETRKALHRNGFDPSPFLSGTGNLTPYAADNYDLMRGAVDAARRQIHAEVGGAAIRGGKIADGTLEATRWLADLGQNLSTATIASTRVEGATTHIGAIMQGTKITAANQARASFERVAQAFIDARAGKPAFEQMLNEQPRLAYALGGFLDWDNFLTASRGHGITDADDLFDYFKTTKGWAELASGNVANYTSHNLVELPRYGGYRAQLTTFKNWTRNVIAWDEEMGKAPRSIRAMFQDRDTLTARNLGLMSVREAKKLGQALTGQVPFERALSLEGPTAIPEFRKLMNLGVFTNMPDAVRAQYVEDFIAAATPSLHSTSGVVARRNTVRAFLTDSFQRAGLANDPESLKLLSKLDEHHYAVDGLDQVRMGTKQFRTALLPIRDHSTKIGIPDFNQMVAASRKQGYMREAFGFVNTGWADAFFGKYWKVAQLMRIGFIPRAAGEELLSTILRVGSRDYWRSQAYLYATRESGSTIKGEAAIAKTVNQRVAVNSYDLLTSRWQTVAKEIKGKPTRIGEFGGVAHYSHQVDPHAVSVLDFERFDNFRQWMHSTIADFTILGENGAYKLSPDDLTKFDEWSFLAHWQTARMANWKRQALGSVLDPETIKIYRHLMRNATVQHVYADMISGVNAYDVFDIQHAPDQILVIGDDAADGQKPLRLKPSGSTFEEVQIPAEWGDDPHLASKLYYATTHHASDPVVREVLAETEGLITTDQLDDAVRAFGQHTTKSTVLENGEPIMVDRVRRIRGKKIPPPEMTQAERTRYYTEERAQYNVFENSDGGDPGVGFVTVARGGEEYSFADRAEAEAAITSWIDEDYAKVEAARKGGWEFTEQASTVSMEEASLAELKKVARSFDIKNLNRFKAANRDELIALISERKMVADNITRTEFQIRSSIGGTAQEAALQRLERMRADLSIHGVVDRDLLFKHMARPTPETEAILRERRSPALDDWLDLPRDLQAATLGKSELAVIAPDQVRAELTRRFDERLGAWMHDSRVAEHDRMWLDDVRGDTRDARLDAVTGVPTEGVHSYYVPTLSARKLTALAERLADPAARAQMLRMVAESDLNPITKNYLAVVIQRHDPRLMTGMAEGAEAINAPHYVPVAPIGHWNPNVVHQANGFFDAYLRAEFPQAMIAAKPNVVARLDIPRAEIAKGFGSEPLVKGVDDVEGAFEIPLPIAARTRAVRIEPEEGAPTLRAWAEDGTPADADWERVFDRPIVLDDGPSELSRRKKFAEKLAAQHESIFWGAYGHRTDWTVPALRNRDLSGLTMTHIQGTPYERLPASVIAPIMEEENPLRFYDRMIRFGMDKTIGPAISAVVRQPLYAMNFEKGWKAAESAGALLRNAKLDAGMAARLEHFGVNSLDELRDTLDLIPSELRNLDHVTDYKQWATKVRNHPRWVSELPGDERYFPPQLDKILDAAPAHLDALKKWQTMDRAWTDYMVDVASTRGVRDTIPYIDDHRIRSSFQSYVGNVVPFWFAQEQFYKRWARTLQYSPEALHRGMLYLHGLRSAGMTYRDQNGNEVYNIPLAEAASHLLAQVPLAEKYFGASLELPVAFNLTGRVDRTLPGMGADTFALPSLGPLATLALNKAAIAHIPGAEPLQSFLVPEFARDRGTLENLLPSWFIRANPWTTPKRDSLDTAFAMMQASEAEGHRMLLDAEEAEQVGDTARAEELRQRASELMLSPDADTHEAEKWIAEIQNWSSAATVLRGVMGFFTPAQPQVNFGDIKLRTEIRDLMELTGNLDEAFGIYMARHPEAGAYTVFDTNVPSKAQIGSTELAYEWMSGNRDFIKEHPTAAPWLIPRGSSDSAFSRKAWLEQTSLGIRTDKELKESFLSMRYAAAADLYFAGRDNYEIAYAKLEGDPDGRRALNDEWKAWKDSYLASHPIFDETLTQKGTSNHSKTIMADVTKMLEADNLPDSPNVKGLRLATEAYAGYQQYYDQLGDSAEGTRQRDALRVSFLAWGDQFQREYPELQSFWRTVVEPITGLREERMLLEAGVG